MKVKECTVLDFFKGKNTFEVPVFQRRYAWKEKHFSMLWDDILTVADGVKKRHFMGTVIFEPFKTGSRLFVIDGQQRLATFTILLKALESAAKENGIATPSTLTKMLTVNRRGRFVPSLPDRESFEHLLGNPGLLKRGTHKSVYTAYTYFFSVIDNYFKTTAGQKPKKFSRLFTAITQRMIFVELALSGQDDAHSIFETINYAGVPLTPADLARNLVLGMAKKSDSPEELNEKYWQPLERRLEDSVNLQSKRARKAELQKVLPELIRTYLIVKKKRYISASDTFSVFRSHCKTGNLREILGELETTSFHFCKFLNPENENSKKIRRYLHNFVDLRMTTHYPLLVVLYSAMEEGRISASELTSCMQYIESFVVRRAFNSKVSRDLGKVFAELAGKLSAQPEKGCRYVDAFKRLLTEKKWPSDDDFSACFLSSPIYTTSPAFARYALVSIEKKKTASYGELSFGNEIQIEHVFPQQSKQNDWDAKDVSELKKHLHVIGNLTLTSKNQSLKNESFDTKKHIYKTSPYWITSKSIANKRSWTGQEINRRSNLLLREALALWPGP